MSRSNEQDARRRAETRALVQAAETVMKRAFADGGMRGELSKSQMSQLIGVCQEAACHDEVANYLRYQAGRRDSKWTQAMVKGTIAEIEGIFAAQGIADDADADRMDRWGRYATFLARAFTWHKAVEPDQGKRGRR